MIIKQKLKRMKNSKFKILKPVKENDEAFVCNKAVIMAHRRISDDLEYMKGGPNAHVFRFLRN